MTLPVRAAWYKRTYGKDLRDIPVIINNRNRLSYMLELIAWLERAEMRNIIILDNDSTYPPLLEYYAQTKYEVVRLGENIGHLALLKPGIFDRFKDDFFIYTDPDVLPTDECPLNCIEVIFDILIRNDVDKVGFNLRIDDLPDHYCLKQEVVEKNQGFWRADLGRWSKKHSCKVFDALIDSTFALYRPGLDQLRGGWDPWYNLRCLRTGFPYTARHLPWYENTSRLSEEEMYYADHASSLSTWITKLKNAQSVT